MISVLDHIRRRGVLFAVEAAPALVAIGWTLMLDGSLNPKVVRLRPPAVPEIPA